MKGRRTCSQNKSCKHESAGYCAVRRFHLSRSTFVEVAVGAALAIASLTSMYLDANLSHVVTQAEKNKLARKTRKTPWVFISLQIHSDQSKLAVTLGYSSGY